MWGGRFAGGPAEVMREINASIAIDKRLWREDIAASRAHAAMLGQTGHPLAPRTPRRSTRASPRSPRNMKRASLVEDPALEDIHMHVEHRLGELIGPAAGRLHTARSRNDQVATDFKLFVRSAIDETLERIDALEDVLLTRAEEHAATVMPGFTHLQSGQPVTLGHHLMAYQEMLVRDRSRFADARARMNECPLGSRRAGRDRLSDRPRRDLRQALGFDRPTANSLDAVSDRDFVVDYLARRRALTAIHLSRLAEEIILWASQPFGFVTLPDAWSTGSSIMPNKRNPDAAELVRGHSARIVGDLVALLVLLKGLPLAYAKDLQDDKPPLFDAHDLLVAEPRGDGRNDRRPDIRAREGCAPPPPRAMPPPPTSPTGWCAKPMFRSARRTISPAARSPPPRRAAWRSTSYRSTNSRPSTRASTEAALAVLSVEASVAVARLGWRNRAGPGSRSDRGGACRPAE